MKNFNYDFNFIENLVILALLKIGINPALKGFKYLTCIITFNILNFDKKLAVHADLYMFCSKKFNVPCYRIERCIRFSLSNAWKNFSINSLNNFLKNNIFSFSDLPTNKSFIDCISMRILTAYLF